LGEDLLELVTIERAEASIKVQELLKIGIQHCFSAAREKSSSLYCE
jgi:hypothetical protein